MKIADCGFDDRCKAEHEENYLQRWKIQQEETKERLRYLNHYPSGPERPDKLRKGKPLVIQNTKKLERKTRKPKYPTPPQSPAKLSRMKTNVTENTADLDSLISMSDFCNMDGTSENKSNKAYKNKNKRTRNVNTNGKQKNESLDKLQQQLSDDSGWGTCTTSDFSDDYAECEIDKANCNCEENEKPILCQNDKLKNHILMLKTEQYRILVQLLITENALADIVEDLRKILSSSQVEKICWFLQDVERITLLLRSLSKRLATVESMLTNTTLVKKESLTNKMIMIKKQLKDAATINDRLDLKLLTMLNTVEKNLGVRTRNNFLMLIKRKTDLLVCSKEKEELVCLYELKNITLI